MFLRIEFRFFLALVSTTWFACSAPAPALAQSSAGGKAPLEAIRGSLESIQERPARRRWKADVALWDVVGDHIGHLDKSAILAIAPHLHDMTMMATQMVGGQEKKRWSANIELWRRLDSHPSPLTRDDLKAMRMSFEVMSTPVGDNALPGDRERWAANCALWRSALESLPQ
jgi:hypothetical protein